MSVWLHNKSDWDLFADVKIENKFTAMDQRLATIEAGKFNMFNVLSFMTSSN